MIDLRSDTVTKPTAAMLAAMFAAEVGDDVYAEDPTVNQLEERIAAYFGHEAAVFVPTGTMANQIAIRIQTRPGDELLTETSSHIILWEAGGPAVHSGVSTRTVTGRHGILEPHHFDGLIRPDDMHSVRTRLVCLENTHNRGGGTITPLETIRAISQWAKSHGLAMHLDGARIWNTIAETGIPGRVWAEPFDTVSVCFSKGLGAPVGSAILGNRDLMREARRVRKLFGGAMRQIGYLAAACVYALDHHVDRLRDDHTHARIIGEAIADTPGLTLIPPRIETNLVWCEVASELGSPQSVAARLREQGVLLAPLGERTLRAVTHLNISRAECERAAEMIRQTLLRL
jgi:threonine aldolase